MEVYDETGQLTDDTDSVLKSGQDEFAQLFSSVSGIQDFDEDFYTEISNFKDEFEQRVVQQQTDSGADA